MQSYINSLVDVGGPVLAMIAIGFDLACGFWLFAEFARFIDWIVDKIFNRRKK